MCALVWAIAHYVNKYITQKEMHHSKQILKMHHSVETDRIRYPGFPSTMWGKPPTKSAKQEDKGSTDPIARLQSPAGSLLCWYQEPRKFKLLQSLNS
jgi:hypothetical protein